MHARVNGIEHCDDHWWQKSLATQGCGLEDGWGGRSYRDAQAFSCPRKQVLCGTTTPLSLSAFLKTNLKFIHHYHCTEILPYQVPPNVKSLRFVVKSCMSYVVLSWLRLEYCCKLVLSHHLLDQPVKDLLA